MPSDRPQMIAALKEVVVPELRRRGFAGSFPHLQRTRDDVVQLLMFQFNKYGGSFIVEIAVAQPSGTTLADGSRVTKEKLTVGHASWQWRYRLGQQREDGDGIWFDYRRRTLLPSNPYRREAQRVLRYLDEAEAWWESQSTRFRSSS